MDLILSLLDDIDVIATSFGEGFFYIPVVMYDACAIPNDLWL